MNNNIIVCYFFSVKKQLWKCSFSFQLNINVRIVWVDLRLRIIYKQRYGFFKKSWLEWVEINCNSFRFPSSNFSIFRSDIENPICSKRILIDSPFHRVFIWVRELHSCWFTNRLFVRRCNNFLPKIAYLWIN